MFLSEADTETVPRAGAASGRDSCVSGKVGVPTKTGPVHSHHVHADPPPGEEAGAAGVLTGGLRGQGGVDDSEEDAS